MIYVCATIKFNSKIVDHPMPTKHSLCRKSMSQGIFSSETRDLRAANVSAHFAHARKVTGNPWIDGWPKESKMVMGNLVSKCFKFICALSPDSDSEFSHVCCAGLS